MTEFNITDKPDPGDLEALRVQLASFNDLDVGPSNMTPLAIFVPGEDGTLNAGGAVRLAYLCNRTFSAVRHPHTLGPRSAARHGLGAFARPPTRARVRSQ